jgi:hypothetical protein
MLMESEQSMAREDREGSGAVVEFMAFVSCILGESNLRARKSGRQSFSNLVMGGVSWMD